MTSALRLRLLLAVLLALPVGLAAACGDDEDDAGQDIPLNLDEYHHPACAEMQRRVVPVDASMDTEAILEVFVDAQPGDIIQFEAGSWRIERELSLDAPCVVVRGAGPGETVLDWTGTTSGKGILASGRADNFTAEDFTILNTFDNGIEVRGTENIILRRLHVEWTGDASSSNGRYAIYPVECRNLLMEHNVARRAADAGIYVGQCHNAVLRWNTAHENVSGIQVENTLGAEVYENLAYNNVLGMLIHDLPGRPTTNGDNTRVYRNALISNNFRNFSRQDDITFVIPSGSGMIVLARDNVEIFDNTFEDHQSVHFAAVSYLLISQNVSDPAFDPYPRRIHLYNNTFSGGGNNPDITRDLGLLLTSLQGLQPGEVIPPIVHDFVLPEGATGDNPHQFCIGDDYDGHFLNLNMDLEALAAQNIGQIAAGVDNDITPFRCSVPAVPETPMLATVGPGNGALPTMNR